MAPKSRHRLFYGQLEPLQNIPPTSTPVRNPSASAVTPVADVSRQQQASHPAHIVPPQITEPTLELDESAAGKGNTTERGIAEDILRRRERQVDEATDNDEMGRNEEIGQDIHSVFAQLWNSSSIPPGAVSSLLIYGRYLLIV